MPLVMPLCPRCRLRACAYQHPAFHGRVPQASSLCSECLRAVGADALGSVVRVQPLPVRQGGAPRLPQPELEGGTSDETIAPVALMPRVCTTAEGLEAALRESLMVTRPLASWASKPVARHAMARSFEPDAHERARMRRIGRTVVS